MFNSNFSDRFNKSMAGFKKAHTELTALKADIETETKATEEHQRKLKAASEQVNTALDNLAPFVGVSK